MNENSTKTTERIAKQIARRGFCSRRDAEKLIMEGKVKLNGEIVTSPALNISDDDVISIEGKVLNSKEKTKLWLYHKPSGLITTHNDPKGRENVFANLPKELGRVISVGRLDLTSEGLLLLTNDGELARKLEHPTSGLRRVYRVRAHGKITQSKLESLQKGIVVDNIKYGPIDAFLEKDDKSNVWIKISLHEGKNREIRKVLKALGLEVNRLIRISYGPFELGNLGRGEILPADTRKIQTALPSKKIEGKNFNNASVKRTKPRTKIKPSSHE